MARSRARFFRIDSAFPASAPGRHHIGPFEACSSFTRVTACQVARPPFCGLCREVPTRPVSRPNRSPAIESNHQLFEWVLPPLVICPFRAHAEARPTANYSDVVLTQYERAVLFATSNDAVFSFSEATHAIERCCMPSPPGPARLG